MSNSTPTFEDILAFVLDKVAKRTKTPRDTLTAETLLANVGVDSLAAVLICGHCEDEYDLELEPSVMFQCKTGHEVAEVIHNMLATS